MIHIFPAFIANREILVEKRNLCRLYIKDSFIPKNAVFNPLPDDKILDWSKSKQSADYISKCIENEK